MCGRHARRLQTHSKTAPLPPHQVRRRFAGHLSLDAHRRYKILSEGAAARRRNASANDPAMVELADTGDSKSPDFTVMGVRLPLAGPTTRPKPRAAFISDLLRR